MIPRNILVDFHSNYFIKGSWTYSTNIKEYKRNQINITPSYSFYKEQSYLDISGVFYLPFIYKTIYKVSIINE